jgi:LuxR family transcriptional regulator, maltose regulon positive regulatory protein
MLSRQSSLRYVGSAHGHSVWRDDQRAPGARLASVDGSPAGPAPILVAGKLRPPALRAQIVTRSSLLELLRGGSGRRLTVVACPAGFGKTTLLAQWHEIENVHQPVAWLTLDEHDNDPVVLWSYIIEALAQVCPAIRQAELAHMLQATADLDTVLSHLVNELCQLDSVTLIVDDCHRLSASAAGDSLAWFIRHAPQTFRLVLSTRTEPLVPLGALRAHGEVLDLRADDLRFTPSEADVFLNEHLGLDLRLADVAGLVERTGGWPAGLSLAAVSLQRATDRHALISRLGPSDRYMAEFLLTEVLDAHDLATQVLMTRCSVLDRLSGPLCDAVVGVKRSGALLAALSRSNLLVTPIPDQRGWYRVRPFFAKLLRAELERREPGLAPTLHRRACAWYRDHGTVDEAIPQAMAACSYAEAADLISTWWATYASDGSHARVLAWLRRLPDELLSSDARLLLVQAWMLTLTAKWQAAGQAIAAVQRLGELGDEPLPDGFSSAEASLAMLRASLPGADLASQVRNARRATQLEGIGSPWRWVACWTAGLALYRQGELGEADCWFAESLALAPSPPCAGLPVTASSLAYRSLIAGDRGDFDRQRTLAEQATDLVRARGAEKAGVVPLALGVSLAARGRPVEALPQVESGIALLRQAGGHPTDMATALLYRATVLSAAGDPERSAAAINEALGILASCPDAGLLARRLKALEPAFRKRREYGSGQLTGRELRVLKLLNGDLSERDIGSELYVSYNTVHSHVRSIYRKLGSSSRTHALKRARELELF